MKVGIDSYCFHRFFGEVYDFQEKPEKLKTVDDFLEFAKKLDVNLVNIDKQRDLHTGQVTATSVHGDVNNKIVIIFDDSVVSGGTVIETAKLLKEQGANSVHFLATHGLFVNDSQNKIQQSEVDSVLVSNSIQHASLVPKITELSVASLFAESLTHWL